MTRRNHSARTFTPATQTSDWRKRLGRHQEQIAPPVLSKASKKTSTTANDPSHNQRVTAAKLKAQIESLELWLLCQRLSAPSAKTMTNISVGITLLLLLKSLIPFADAVIMQADGDVNSFAANLDDAENATSRYEEASLNQLVEGVVKPAATAMAEEVVDFLTATSEFECAMKYGQMPAEQKEKIRQMKNFLLLTTPPTRPGGTARVECMIDDKGGLTARAVVPPTKFPELPLATVFIDLTDLNTQQLTQKELKFYENETLQSLVRYLRLGGEVTSETAATRIRVIAKVLEELLSFKESYKFSGTSPVAAPHGTCEVAEHMLTQLVVARACATKSSWEAAVNNLLPETDNKFQRARRVCLSSGFATRHRAVLNELENIPECQSTVHSRPRGGRS